MDGTVRGELHDAVAKLEALLEDLDKFGTDKDRELVHEELTGMLDSWMCTKCFRKWYSEDDKCHCDNNE